MQTAWVGTSTLLVPRNRTRHGLCAIKRPRIGGRTAVPLRRKQRAQDAAQRAQRAAPRAALDPVDEPLGPARGTRFGLSRWGEGLRGDLRRRGPLYLGDWKDGFTLKAIPTVLFLYCACLAPVVAFGGITSALTGGSMGVVEFLLASGATGMIYAIGSGQPLTFLAPTGLTLAFTTALYAFCELAAIPFLPTYAWVGIWTSLILVILSISNFSDLIKHCTRFTDDIFNSLIATSFLYESGRSLASGFFASAADKTRPFTALALALGTVIVGRTLSSLRTSRYFVRRVRTFFSDFGPILAVVSMSALAALPAVANVGLPALSIPSTFSLAHGRPLFIPLLATPMYIRVVSILPAILLCVLFFLDQNISVRVVNARIDAAQKKSEKGPAYHLDMLALAACTLVCAVFAMPLMCAGTVQSLAHVQALSNVESVNGTERVVSVVENRLTPFLIHALIFGSLLLLPVVSKIPMAVNSGLFLFLGRNMMGGNDFLSRIRYMFMDPALYPEDSPMRKVPAIQVHAFTLLQIACLSMLWILKLNKRTSMFFPTVIGALMLIRSKVVPRFFPKETLVALDAEIGQTDREESMTTQGAEKDGFATAGAP